MINNLIIIGVPLVSIAHKWIEKQNLIPSEILGKNILGLFRLLSDRHALGVFIQKINQFYEIKVKRGLNPLFNAFHESLTHVQEKTTFETLVHPDRLPTVE